MVRVIDDDIYILKIFGFLLKKNGFEFETFESAEKALESSENPSVTIVFSDIHLPGMNGFELAEKYASRNFKLVALTSEEGRKDERIAQLFDGYLLKPFDEAQLLQALELHSGTKLEFPYIDAMFENEDDKREILVDFCDETHKDLETLENALRESRREEVELIVHRLAGRLAQFSQPELSLIYKELEALLYGGESLEDTKDAILLVNDKTRGFLKKVGDCYPAS